MTDTSGVVLRVGEPFNPRYEVCGFFPDEIVGRRRDLTDGQKWLYSRMVRWARVEDGNRSNERAGEVWRAHKTIAKKLGKSEKHGERQVRRDLARLESVGLLAHRRRDGRKSNTYLFLFQAGFERTPMSGQRDDDGTSVASLSGHLRPVTSHLNGRPCPPNPKELNHQRESSSSSTQQNGRFVDPAEASPAATPTTPALSLNGSHPTATPAPWTWTNGDREQAREAMRLTSAR